MSPPRPQKGSALPGLSISRERPGESKGVRRADGTLPPGRANVSPGQVSVSPSPPVPPGTFLSQEGSTSQRAK